jgi:hypothetical protein
MRAVALYSIQRVILKKIASVKLMAEFWEKVQENRVMEVLNMSWIARGYERINITHTHYHRIQRSPNQYGLRTAPNGYDANLGQAILNASLSASQRAIAQSHAQNGIRSGLFKSNVKRQRVTSDRAQAQNRKLTMEANMAAQLTTSITRERKRNSEASDQPVLTPFSGYMDIDDD